MNLYWIFFVFLDCFFKWRVQSNPLAVLYLKRQHKYYKYQNSFKDIKGQVLLESLITLSVFLIFVLGILYLTLIYQAKLYLHHIAYENSVCLHYTISSDQCVRQSKKWISQALPYLNQVRVTFQSYSQHQESFIKAYFPPHTAITAKESFYAKY